jgi:predicted phage tail protein
MSKELQQCSAMQQVVRLLGDLGERYGTEHTYENLRTPADAIKLLCINSPKLQEELIHAHEHGIGYRLIQAGADLGYEDLQLPIGSNDLILTPVVTGSGGSTTQILTGVGLIAFSILTAGAGAGFLGLGAGLTAPAFTLGATASTALGLIGTSLILGGVATLLSPQPVVPTLGGGAIRGSGESGATDGPQSVIRGADGRQSYMFTGPANTVGVGATIPVIYGEVITGSQLLSAKIEVADESDPLKTAIKDPGPNTVLVGGEKISGLTYASGFRFRTWNYSGIKPFDASANRRTLSLVNGNAEKLRDVDYKTDIRAKNYMIFFELTNGLFDYVSGPGTTLVDGFITFEVLLEVQTIGPNPDVVRFQVTVQGLLNPNQSYRWMQYIRYPRIDDDLEPGNLYTTITIIDFRCAAGCNLSVVCNKYEGFTNDAYNTAPVTT